MKGALASFQFDCDRLERRFLRLAQDGLNRIHLARQAGNRQIRPAMRARNILQTAIVLTRIIQPNPTGQMREWLRARPI